MDGINSFAIACGVLGPVWVLAFACLLLDYFWRRSDDDLSWKVMLSMLAFMLIGGAFPYLLMRIWWPHFETGWMFILPVLSILAHTIFVLILGKSKRTFHSEWDPRFEP